jgi:hypothetical protein
VRPPPRRPGVEEVCPLPLPRAEKRFERPLLEADPEPPRDLPGRLRRARVGEARGDVDRDDAAGPERLHPERRHERRVDPPESPRTTDRSPLPSTKPRIPKASAAKSSRSSPSSPSSGAVAAAGPSRSAVTTSSANRASRATSSPSAARGEAPAVEDQLVAHADGVHEGDRAAVAARRPEPLARDPDAERRGDEGEQHLGAPRREVGGRVGRIPLVPDVLADERARARPRHVERLARAARQEPPGLEEDLVRRQEPLGLHVGDRTPREEERGVRERRVLWQPLGRAGEAPDEAGRPRRSPPRRLAPRLEGGRHEPRVEEEVARRVADEGHLREDDDVGAVLPRAGLRRHEGVEVPREVPDARLDLREADPQAISFATAARRSSVASTGSRRRQTSSPRRNVR